MITLWIFTNGYLSVEETPYVYKSIQITIDSSISEDVRLDALSANRIVISLIQDDGQSYILVYSAVDS